MKVGQIASQVPILRGESLSYISSTVVFLHQYFVNYLLETTFSEGEQCVCAAARA